MSEWNTIADAAGELAGAAAKARDIAQTLSSDARRAATLNPKGGGISLTKSDARDRLTKIISALEKITDKRIELEKELGPSDEPTPAAPDQATESPTKGSPPSESVQKTAKPESRDINQEFGNFLGMVGRSVVAAQRQLDVLSQDYMRQQGPGAPVLPSLFRIPKLSADIKFALEKGTETSLNLVFFGTRDKRAEEHQQSMSFEVVSAPPPPELLRELASRQPHAGLVLDPLARNTLLNELTALKSPDKELELDVLTDPKTWDQVVVVSVPSLNAVAAPDSEQFLILADPSEKHLLGVWHWRGPKLTVVYRFSLQPKRLEEVQPAHDFVVAFGQQQAEFLRRLRGTP